MKKRMTLQEKAFLALKKAVKEVVEKHIRTGRPIPVWKNGKVVRIPAKKLRAINSKAA